MSARLRRAQPSILLALLAAAILAGMLQGPPGEPERPARSAADPRAGGLAVWAELLSEREIEVELRSVPPASGAFDEASTAVILDPGAIGEQDAGALAAFLAAGGRLVIGGSVPAATLERIIGERLTPGPGGGAAPPLVPATETRGVTRVSSPGGQRYSRAGGALPLLGARGSYLLLGAGSGAGEALLLADPEPVSNARIAEADNAQLALNLVRGEGRGRVSFLEALAPTPADGAEGLGALPASWGWGFAGLLIAGLLLIASRLRRLGPPDGEPGPRGEPRIGYVDALARMLSRTSRPLPAAEPVRAAALQRLRDRGGGLGGEDADKLAAEAELAGLPRQEAAALASELDDPRAAVLAGRALGRLWRREG